MTAINEYNLFEVNVYLHIIDEYGDTDTKFDTVATFTTMQDAEIYEQYLIDTYPEIDMSISICEGWVDNVELFEETTRRFIERYIK